MWLAGTVLAAAGLMFCYLRIAGVTQVNSDGAGLELQAWDVLHGNVLLHGWWATDVSFYTTELPQYLVVTAAAGLRPEVVHICSALTYTLLVLLAAFVARGRARGAHGAVRALLAAGVILAPQPTGPTLVLLGSPDHVGTGVPVLVLLLLLDRAAPRWWVPVAAGALLAWSIIGDPLIEVVGALPLFLACALRASWIAWSRRAPGPVAASPRRWSAAWYELSLAAAAVAAVPVAAAGNWLIRDLGGFSMASPWYHLQSLHEIVRGVPVAVESVLVLFGADYQGVSGAGNVAFALVHLIGVAVVLAGFAVAVWGLVRPFAALARPRRPGAGAAAPGAAGPGDLVAGILVLAIAANCAAFLLEVPMSDVYVSHEIGPVLALGAALAGRTLGGAILGGGVLGGGVLGGAVLGGQAATAGEVPGRRVPGEVPAAGGRAPGDSAPQGGATVGSAVEGAPGDSAPQGGATVGGAVEGAPGGQVPGDPVPEGGALENRVPGRRTRAGARRVLLPALAAGLACYVVLLGIAAAHRQAPPRNVGLTAWLTQHHLTSGFAPYWEASSITVDSGGAITVLSVTDTGWHGRLAPQHWLTDVQLAAHMAPATFVILSPAEKVRHAAVTATFGRAPRSYSYGHYTILVWPGNLLPRFALAASP
jgi:hypothetical protein